MRLSRISSSTDSYIGCLCLCCFIRSFSSRAKRCLSPGGSPALPEIPCLWLPMPLRLCCLLIYVAPIPDFAGVVDKVRCMDLWTDTNEAPSSSMSLSASAAICA